MGESEGRLFSYQMLDMAHALDLDLLEVYSVKSRNQERVE